MAGTLDRIAQQALKLPAEQRGSLAHKLIASLDSKVDERAEAEWLAVIGRRLQELDEGKVACRPIDEVIRELRAKAR